MTSLWITGGSVWATTFIYPPSYPNAAEFLKTLSDHFMTLFLTGHLSSGHVESAGFATIRLCVQKGTLDSL